MATRRYFITVLSTRDCALRVGRPYDGTLNDAQRWAETWLNDKFSAPTSDAPAWDRWAVAATDRTNSLPKLVAYGDRVRVTWSALDHGWVD